MKPHRRLTLLALAPAFLAIAAQAAPDTGIAAGTRVRYLSSRMEAGWHEGTVTKANGCTMIKFDRPAPGGYTMISMVVVKRLQRAQAGGWVDVPLAPVLAADPARCREGDND